MKVSTSTISTQSRALPSRVFRPGSLKYRVSFLVHSFPPPENFTFSRSLSAWIICQSVSLLHTLFPRYVPNWAHSASWFSYPNHPPVVGLQSAQNDEMQLAPVRGMMDTSVIRLLNSFTAGKYTQPVLIFVASFTNFSCILFTHLPPPTFSLSLANLSQLKVVRPG